MSSTRTEHAPEVVEAVARAICDHRICMEYSFPSSVEEFKDFRAIEVDSIWHFQVGLARAVLAAMPDHIADAPSNQSKLVAELVEALERWQYSGCPDCSGDCGSANPPVLSCIMSETSRLLTRARQIGGKS